LKRNETIKCAIVTNPWTMWEAFKLCCCSYINKSRLVTIRSTLTIQFFIIFLSSTSCDKIYLTTKNDIFVSVYGSCLYVCSPNHNVSKGNVVIIEASMLFGSRNEGRKKWMLNLLPAALDQHIFNGTTCSSRSFSF